MRQAEGYPCPLCYPASPLLSPRFPATPSSNKLTQKTCCGEHSPKVKVQASCEACQCRQGSGHHVDSMLQW